MSKSIVARLWRRAHASLRRSGMILAWHRNKVNDAGHSADVMNKDGQAGKVVVEDSALGTWGSRGGDRKSKSPPCVCKERRHKEGAHSDYQRKGGPDPAHENMPLWRVLFEKAEWIAYHVLEFHRNESLWSQAYS
jgi:hypothetical protein